MIYTISRSFVVGDGQSNSYDLYSIPLFEMLPVSSNVWGI